VENQDPLYRFFAREGGLGRKLLSTVRRDLTDVVKVCGGTLKQTNHLRTLMSHLTKGKFAPTPLSSSVIQLSGCRDDPNSLAKVQGRQDDFGI